MTSLSTKGALRNQQSLTVNTKIYKHNRGAQLWNGLRPETRLHGLNKGTDNEHNAMRAVTQTFPVLLKRFSQAD